MPARRSKGSVRCGRRLRLGGFGSGLLPLVQDPHRPHVVDAEFGRQGADRPLAGAVVGHQPRSSSPLSPGALLNTGTRSPSRTDNASSSPLYSPRMYSSVFQVPFWPWMSRRLRISSVAPAHPLASCSEYRPLWHWSTTSANGSSTSSPLTTVGSGKI